MRLRLPAVEQHGFVRALDDRAQFGERHRLVVNFHLAEGDQSIDKIAQAVFVKIQATVWFEHRGHFTFWLMN